jgi:hypothetical protein
LSPVSNETTDSKSKTVSAQILRESIPTLKTFQAVRNAATGRGTSKWMRAVLISNEEAVQDLKLMDNSMFMKSDVETVTKAPETRR